MLRGTGRRPPRPRPGRHPERVLQRTPRDPAPAAGAGALPDPAHDRGRPRGRRADRGRPARDARGRARVRPRHPGPGPAQRQPGHPRPRQHPPRDQALSQILRTIEVAREAGVPIAPVQHEMPEGAPVFASGTPGWELHSDIEATLPEGTKRITKNYASIFDDTDALACLKENSVDTVTLVGFMTNNCVIGSAVGAEPLGITAEVLSDATGAISIGNEAGSVAAQQVHETLMAVLNSNLAAVATTDAWAEAVRSGSALQGSDLGSSAMQGRSEH